MTEQELEEKATELIQLSIEKKELDSKIKTLKAEILQYAKDNNINEKSWSADNGHVEVVTTTKYSLADIPSEVKVPSDIAAIDIAEKAFKSKIVLSKEGKRMFKEQCPTITKLMIASLKKNLKVII